MRIDSWESGELSPTPPPADGFRKQSQIDGLVRAYSITPNKGFLWHPEWGKLDLTPFLEANLELLIVWIQHNK